MGSREGELTRDPHAPLFCPHRDVPRQLLRCPVLGDRLPSCLGWLPQLPQTGFRGQEPPLKPGSANSSLLHPQAGPGL